MWRVLLSLAASLFQVASAFSSTAQSIGVRGLQLQEDLEITYSKKSIFARIPQETKFTEKLAKDGRMAECWYDLVLKDAKAVCQNQFFHSNSPLLKLCNHRTVDAQAAKNYVIDEVIPAIPIPRSNLDMPTLSTNISHHLSKKEALEKIIITSHHMDRESSPLDAKAIGNMTMSGLTNRQSSQLEGLAGSCQSPTVSCNANARYRTHDGFCNNIQRPEEGAIGHELIRFFPNAYEDGKSVPRGGQPNFRLPNPRDISVQLHHERPIHSRPKGNDDQVPDPNYTHMVMQWGQFLDHDITFTPEGELDCCDVNVANDPRCFNIDTTRDAFYQSRGRSCLSFTRSDARCSRDTARNQFNGITAFIDGSNIYSSSDEDNVKLRTLQDGRLKVNSAVGHGNLPSRSQIQLEVEESKNGEGSNDFASGDTRVMEQPGLASMHTLFMNEHNRIAAGLKPRLRSLLVGRSNAEQDRILYEETRKIVYSEMQQITYNEFLTVILGDNRVAANNLRSTSRSSYDPNVDPSIRNEFATVAFRFGHTLVSGTFRPVEDQPFALRDEFFKERYVSGRGGNAWEDNVEGIAMQPCRRYDLTVTDDLTDFLFVKPGEGSGGDLAARNIQRGRDHGIPGYNTLRALCGLPTLTNTRTAPAGISQANWDRLGRVYGNVNDIDPWTGGLAETPVSGGIVGPTFACIIERQFNFMKFGDRFFFTHGTDNNGRGLDNDAAGAVVQRRLSDVICDNTDSANIQSNVFRSASSSNPKTRCGGSQHTSNLNLDVMASSILRSYSSRTSSALTSCQDQNTNCPAWSAGGYCSQQNVRDICKKSCGVCGSEGRCSSNADCPASAPYCSQWNYCRPEAKYNSNGGRSGVSSSTGRCRSHYECPSYASCCSQYGYCHAPGDQCYF